MGKTKIEWATRTWNPVTGCTKVSAGCKNCYAERFAERFWKDRKFTDVMVHADRLPIPLWREPQRVFVNSMSDLFHPEVPDKVIANVWMHMLGATRHRFLILTKRPERMKEVVNRLIAEGESRDRPMPTHIWCGVSVENQAAAEERIPLLAETHAAHRFISFEPLLGAIDLSGIWGATATWGYRHPGDDTWVLPGNIDWFIVGGESGTGARPMHPDWVRSLRDQAIEAEIPFFFKQWGEWAPYQKGLHATNRAIFLNDRGKETAQHMAGSYQTMIHCGKKAAGNLLDGIEWEQYPQELLLNQA